MFHYRRLERDEQMLRREKIIWSVPKVVLVT